MTEPEVEVAWRAEFRRNIDHLNTDKSPKLHSRVISAVLAIASRHFVLPSRSNPNATSISDK